jgi:hypothetical protein
LKPFPISFVTERLFEWTSFGDWACAAIETNKTNVEEKKRLNSTTWPQRGDNFSLGPVASVLHRATADLLVERRFVLLAFLASFSALKPCHFISNLLNPELP